MATTYTCEGCHGSGGNNSTCREEDGLDGPCSCENCTGCEACPECGGCGESGSGHICADVRYGCHDEVCDCRTREED